MSDTRSISRREFLQGAAAAAAGAAVGAGAPATGGRSKPNVIFVFADQLRASSLGCYGDTQARTPNIDRLAAEGCRFGNAISTWPVCSPFRGMMLTGRFPMSNGVVANNFPLWLGQATIATELKARGYQTGYIGKWHLNGQEGDPTGERRFGFDYWKPGQGPVLSGNDWKPEKQTELAVQYIKDNKDKPFCLFMSWNPPHDPYVAPERYMKRFPPEKMTLRKNAAEKELVKKELERHPLPADSRQAKIRREWRARCDDDAGLKQVMSGYYAATCGIDECFGRIMKALDEAKIADDTILVFSSDHGDMMGSHRMIMKQEPFEESIGIPFIVRYPRAIKRGTVTDALLSPVDMMPTLLDLAGAKVPASVEGRSIAEAARGGRSDQQDAVLIMKMQPGGNPWVINAATEWRGVRTKTHTYARLADGGPWILYNNQTDPYQMKNLVNDPAHKQLQDRLEARMKVLLERAHDPFDSAAIRKRILEKTSNPPPWEGDQGAQGSESEG